MNYQQLTQEQRYQIWVYLRTGMNRSEIARAIGVHKSTITRELKRNGSGRWKYNPSRAERMARERHQVKKKHRTAAQTWARVDLLLREEWSPEEISVRLRLEGRPPVSHETIYLYVYRNKQAGGDLYTFLRRRHKYRKRIHKYCKRGAWDTRRPISERPAIVETRLQIGHWESDTIVSARRRGAILSLVERRSSTRLAAKGSEYVPRDSRRGPLP